MNELVLKEKNEVLTYEKLKKHSEDFIEYLDVDDLTLKTYRVGIMSFLNFLKDKEIRFPTRDNVKEYRNMLRKNYCSNTINTYMIGVRAMFKYLAENEKCDNLAVAIKGAKYNNTPKKQVLSKEQVQNIYKNLTDKREKLLFSLLITTGCRGVEIANAKLENIGIHNGEQVLWIKCKKHTDYDEYVKLSDLVLNDLKEYVGDRKTGPIFLSTSNKNNGEGISTVALRRIIKKIFKRFGLDDESFSLHSTRRTSATLMYEEGQSLYDIQQVLHHKNSNTTIRYINAVTRNNNESEYKVSNLLLGGEV